MSLAVDDAGPIRAKCGIRGNNGPYPKWRSARDRLKPNRILGSPFGSPFGACDQKLSPVPRQIAHAWALDRTRKGSNLASFHRPLCDHVPAIGKPFVEINPHSIAQDGAAFSLAIMGQLCEAHDSRRSCCLEERNPEDKPDCQDGCAA